MSRHVALFFIPDMVNENDRANSALSELPEIQLEEIQCEVSMRRMYQCPFIMDEVTKLNYYGVDGIEAFVSEFTHKKKHTRQKPRTAQAAV